MNSLATSPPGDERQNTLAQTAFEGHSRELNSLGLAHQFVDLGVALPELLAHPGFARQICRTESPILLEHALIQPRARSGSKETLVPRGFLSNTPSSQGTRYMSSLEDVPALTPSHLKTRSTAA